jgi:iron complex transport system substrate-binding protein
MMALAAAAGAGLSSRSALAANPSRIVSLDYSLASTLFSLGVVPLAVASLADWKTWVVEPELPASVADLGSSWEINFEVLLGLKPDLILTTPYLDSLKPRLEQYAPVARFEVYTPEGGDILPKAVAATRQLGAMIGKTGEAEAFIARADAYFDACRERIARLGAPPLALVSFLDARHMRIYTAPGLYHNVLARIGLRNAWEKPGNYWGFETLGIERLSEIEDPSARLIAMEPVPADVVLKLGESPLWQALPFARKGQFAVLPGALMFGMLNDAMRFARLVTDYLEASA